MFVVNICDAPAILGFDIDSVPRANVQLGPGQEMVVHWASSHKNTFMFTIVSGQDQEIFWDTNHNKYVWDCIKIAPAGAHNAEAKPR